MYSAVYTGYGPVLSVCLTVCVCVFKSRSSVETAERIELVFDAGASFDLSYTVF